MNAALAMTDDRESRLEQGLRSVDALAERWYRSNRPPSPLHPLEAMRLMHDGAVLGGTTAPMPDDEVAFDQVYATSPVREKSVMDCWYSTGGSAKQKATRLGMSRASLYLLWKTALSYFRGRLHAKGLDV